MEALEKQLEELLEEIEQSTNELVANRTANSPATFYENQLSSEDLNSSSSVQLQESFESNIELESKEENGNLPNTDNLLDIKVIKTSLLGKEQAKKRLQAFCPTKKLDLIRSKFLGTPDEEKPEEKHGIKKPSRKGIHPTEKAKTVIEEIEEIKKIESAYHEALEQQILFNKPDRWRRSASKSRSRSRDRDRKKSKREHRRSRSRDNYRKYKSRRVQKLKYPNSWKELKENNLEVEKLSTLFPLECKINENKIYDFRRQLLFVAPSYPLQRLVANGVNGETLNFPAEYIRFTTNSPSVSYCVNLNMSHDLFDRKCVCNYVPKHYKSMLEQFVNNLKLQCKPKLPAKTTSRKWYPKESTACTLLETSLGLTFLQNYSDDDEQEKEENCNEEDIDSDGVIAEILEDIGKTELLLSKNSEAVVDKLQSSTEFVEHIPEKPKKKQKKKDSKRSKSKKKKSKRHHKKHKVKKEKKNSVVAQDIELSERENVLPNKNINEETDIKQEPKKLLRSRSKSGDTKLNDKQSKKLKRLHSKNDTSTSKVESGLTSLKTQLLLEQKTKEDNVIKTKKIKKSKRRSSKATNSPDLNIESNDLENKNKQHTVKHKKKHKTSKREKKVKIQDKSCKINSDEDGRTSAELRLIIQEKQKILEEHTRREIDEHYNKNEVTMTVQSVVKCTTKPLSENDTENRKGTKNTKLEKAHSSLKEPEKRIHKKHSKESRTKDAYQEKKDKISSKHKKDEKYITDHQEILLANRNKKEEDNFNDSEKDSTFKPLSWNEEESRKSTKNTKLEKNRSSLKEPENKIHKKRSKDSHSEDAYTEKKDKVNSKHKEDEKSATDEQEKILLANRNKKEENDSGKDNIRLKHKKNDKFDTLDQEIASENLHKKKENSFDDSGKVEIRSKHKKDVKFDTLDQEIASGYLHKEKDISCVGFEKHKIHKKGDKCTTNDQDRLPANLVKKEESCDGSDQGILTPLKNKQHMLNVKSSIDHQVVVEGIYALNELAIIDSTDQNLNENDSDIGEFKKQIDKKRQYSNRHEENSTKKRTIALKSNKKKIEEVGSSINSDIGATYNDCYEEMLKVDGTKEQIQKNTDCIDLKSKEDNSSNIIDNQLYSPEAIGINKTNMDMTITEGMLNIKQIQPMVNLAASQTNEVAVITAEKEIGTPNTDEYFSEWESKSDVENTTKPDKLNKSWESEEEVLHKYVNKSGPHKARENSPDKNRSVKARHTNFSLDTTLVQKDTMPFRRQLEERRRRRSSERSPEKFLEMPFNINNVKRERHNWREERSSLRNLYDRSPDRIEMDFRLKNDTSYSLATEDSWENNEFLSIKTEELRLEQERLSLLEERRKLEIEKQRFEELEKQRHQARVAQMEERQRKLKVKGDRNQSQRDYDQFNLNNFIETSRNENRSERGRRNRWDISHKDSNSKLEPTSLKRDEFEVRTFKGAANFNKFNAESTKFEKDLKKQENKYDEKVKKPDLVSERISKNKQLKRRSESPEKLKNEYEKFLELLDPETGKKKILKKGGNLNDSKTKNKKYSISTKLKASKNDSQKHKIKKKVSSGSSSSSWSSSSDSDSSSLSSSSSSSTSTTSTSTSSSSYSRQKKSRKRLVKTKKGLPIVKSITSSSASMKTKAIQVIKNEIVRTVGTGTKPVMKDTAVATRSASKVIRDPGSLLSIGPNVPLPVPSPKVDSSNMSRLASVTTETKSVSDTLIKTQVVEGNIKKKSELPLPGQNSQSCDITVSPVKQTLEVLDIKRGKIKLKSKSDVDDLVTKNQPADSEKIKVVGNDSISAISKSSNKNYVNNDKQVSKDFEKFVSISNTKQAVQDINCGSSRSPKRKREDSSRSRWNPTESPQRTKRCSLSPTQPDTFRSKEYLHKRNDYSPKQRENSPRRKDYSPRRYSKNMSPTRDHRQESIQEVLQRLAGIDNYYPRRKSPIGSPVHGFKRSVADSTISDEQLLQYRVEEHIEPPKYFNRTLGKPPSPKRVPLDQRITQELGIHSRHKTINTTSYSENYQYAQESQQYYDQYHNQQYNETNSKNNYEDIGRGINQNVLQPIPFVDNKFKMKHPPPLQQNEVTNTTQQIKQVGNILEIIPTESLEKPEMPQSSTVSPTIKPVVSETKHVLSTTTALTAATVTSTTTKVTSPITITSTSVLTPISPISKHFSPISPTEFSPTSSTTPISSSPKDMNAEALIKQKMERRAEKDKRKQERELKREEKEKKRNIRQQINLSESDAITESAVSEALSLDNESISVEDIYNTSVDSNNFQWPVPKIIFNSSHKPPEKGILKDTRVSKSPRDINLTPEKRKSVKFSDGIFPGEGTSPSGGEELASPPPAPKKLPKEKRFKKTKIPKAAKVPKRKKVKVKVVRRAEEEEEEDDLPPPPPPPGSPPPHLFPARLKTIINNIHPTVAVSIANSMLQPDTSLAHPPAFRPPGVNVMTHQQRSSLPQPAAQHHLGAFSSSNVTPVSTGLSQVPLSVATPILASQHQHHVGHNNNHHQSPFIGHHHH